MYLLYDFIGLLTLHFHRKKNRQNNDPIENVAWIFITSISKQYFPLSSFYYLHHSQQVKHWNGQFYDCRVSRLVWTSCCQPAGGVKIVCTWQTHQVFLLYFPFKHSVMFCKRALLLRKGFRYKWLFKGINLG